MTEYGSSCPLKGFHNNNPIVALFHKPHAGILVTTQLVCLDLHYFDIASGHSSAPEPASIQTLWFMWACSGEGLRPFYNVLLYMLPTEQAAEVSELFCWAEKKFPGKDNFE